MKTLDKDEIAALGIEGGWVLGLEDFVRYGDLDSNNHVNNKVYHAWFENIRVLYLQGLGVGLVLDGKAAIKPVVRSAYMEFNAQMMIGEDYVSLCHVSKLGRSSYQMDFAVWCAGTFRATGHVTMVMVNATATKSCPIPDDMREIFVTRDGAKTR
ncbi:MAG: hypothetical protein COB84_04990 [Rhodobacteraceae bacterium]|nr:MAG: hypothetical protein COB84_04990 [Paracoccaceae bacterium]